MQMPCSQHLVDTSPLALSDLCVAFLTGFPIWFGLHSMRLVIGLIVSMGRVLMSCFALRCFFVRVHYVIVFVLFVLFVEFCLFVALPAV